MRLEIRELDTSMVYDIGPEGAVLGRERARTDIAFHDESISKRHARIYLEGTTWFLEDLESSNGTYVNEQRISQPLALTVGMSFALAQKRFDVILVEGANGVSSAPSPSDDAFSSGIGAGGFAGDAGAGPRSGGANAANSRDSLNSMSFGPGLGFPPDDPAGLDASSNGRPGQPRSRSVVDPADELAGVEGQGLSYFFVAVPKAIAFYLAAVPKMLVNPVGSIKHGIAEQSIPAMGRMELIAYALPAFLAMSLLQQIGSLVAGVIGGQDLGTVLGGLVTGILTAAILSAVMAIVAGFLGHPVLRWVVDFLKGQSTAKSRTNCFLMGWTTGILTAIPTCIALIVGAVNVPFLNVVPVLIGFVAAGISLLLGYLWALEFRVVRWFQLLLLGLGVLYVLLTGVHLVQAVVYSVGRLLSDDPALVADGPAVDATGAGGAAGEALGENPEAGAGAGAAGAGAAEEAGRANSLSGDAAGAIDPAAATTGANIAANAAANAATAGHRAANANANANAGVAVADGAHAVAGSSVVNSGNSAAGSGSGAAGSAPTLTGTGDNASGDRSLSPYLEHREKRRAIDEAIERDPKLLRDRAILDDYRKLLNIESKRNKVWAKKRAKSAADRKINATLKDADVFDRTRRVVDRLHAKIFGE